VLNQYSMSEYQGRLRVATTTSGVGSSIGSSESANNVFVLESQNGVLEIVGRAENIAPGESIQSARFVGPRGFLVTFRQIDPLFTLDLSDPTQPTIVGQLKVPGFSTFIVPMDSDHLLTVGQYVPQDNRAAGGVQLSIFDISDFAHPSLMSSQVIGQGASSEALFDPKAFTYFPEQNLLALPVSIFDGIFFDGTVIGGPSDGGMNDQGSAPGMDSVPPDGGSDPGSSGGAPGSVGGPSAQGFDGLIVYRATVADGFSELLRLDTRMDNSPFQYTSFTRGVFVGDRVFAVTDLGVVEASVDAPDAPPASLTFQPVKTLPEGTMHEGSMPEGTMPEGTNPEGK